MNAEIEHGHEPGVGALLRASRLRCGEDLRDVATLLRIRYPFLEAIEEGRYNDLPGSAYAVGFVRTYAEHLGLDSKEVVRRFKTEAENLERRSDLDFPVPIAERSTPGGAIVFVGILVAAIAYGAWYVGTSKDSFLVDLVSPLPDRLAALVHDGSKPSGTPAMTAPDAAAGSVAAETGSPGAAPLQPSPMIAEGNPAPMASQTGGEPPLAEDVAPLASPPAEADGPAPTVAMPSPAPAAEPMAANPEPTPPASPAESPASATPPATVAPAPAEVPQAPAVAEPQVPEAAPVDGQAAGEPAAPPSEPVVTASEAPSTVAEAPASQQTQAAGAVAPETTPEATAAPEPTPAPTQTAPEPAAPPPAAAETQAAEDASPPPATEAGAPSSDQVAAIPAVPDVSSPSTQQDQQGPAAATSSRIVVRAKLDSWIQVRDGVARRLLVTRLLRAGDTYRVPDKPGLTLLTGNAGALEILVDGEPVPSIGGVGTVRRDVALDADKLKAGTAVIN